MKMHENSLFAVLLRSPWWVSALLAIGLAVALRLVIPELYALFAALPFAVVEPLRELDAARRSRETHECIYVAAGEITEQAREFAALKNIRLLHGAELAKMLAR